MLKAVLEMVCVAGCSIILLEVGICSLLVGQVFKNVTIVCVSLWCEFMVSEKKWGQPCNIICTHDLQYTTL